MNFFEYLNEYLYLDYPMYVFFLLISVLIYYIIFRKYIVLFVGPLSILIFYLSIYSSTIFFMLFENIIDIRFFYQYVLTTIAFVFGFCIFKPFNLSKMQNEFPSTFKTKKIMTIMYITTIIIYFINEIYLIDKIGFPAFSDVSRLLIYQDVAVNKRISDMLLPMIIMLACMRIKIYQFVNKFDISLLGLIFVDLCLSGSKGAFLSVFSIVTIFSFFSKGLFSRIQASQVKIIGIVIFVFCVIIFVLFGIENFFEAIVITIAGRADGYVNFYGANYFSILNYFYPYDGFQNFLIYFFAAPLSLFRIIPYEAFSIKFPDILNQYMSGTVILGQGVSDVYNIVSLAYLGFIGSLIYSFIIGMIYSYIRNIFVYFCAKDKICQLFYIGLLFNLNALVISISFFMEQITLFLVGFVALLITSNLLFHYLYYKRSN